MRKIYYYQNGHDPLSRVALCALEFLFVTGLVLFVEFRDSMPAPTVLLKGLSYLDNSEAITPEFHTREIVVESVTPLEQPAYYYSVQVEGKNSIRFFDSWLPKTAGRQTLREALTERIGERVRVKIDRNGEIIAISESLPAEKWL